MWLRLLPYAASLTAVLSVLVVINNSAYTRGKAHAEQACKDISIPAAEGAVQEKCNKITSSLKEENNAVLRDAKRIHATYDRLRKAKPVANCVPITAPSGGDVRPNGANISSGELGVSTEWLDTTFLSAATDIARGESCQRQLKNIYILNGVTP